MTLALMITVHVISKKRGYKPSRDRIASPKEIAIQFKDSIWALLIPFGIILGMRFGLFTPTEAGGMAVLFCVVIGTFVYKKLKLRHLPIILRDTVYSTGLVRFLIIGAKVFGYYLEVSNVHKDKVPADWIRKQTLVNAERYITEELKIFEEKILNADGKIREGCRWSVPRPRRERLFA